MQLFDEMICLVGENPMPIYLGIVDLCAEGAEIWLVHSVQTRPQAVAIQKKLGRRWQCPAANLVRVDPYSPANVLSCLGPLMARHRGAILNYTGGTKVMSAFAVQAHCAAAADDMRLGQLCYLEDPSHLFRFGDGAERRVSNRTRLSVRDLVELHGGTQADTGQWPEVTTGDLLRMWKWHQRRELASLLGSAREGVSDYQKLEKQWDFEVGQWRDGPWLQFMRLFTHGSGDHPWWRVGMPSNAEAFEKWDEGWFSPLALQWRFATGIWLELLVGYLVRCALDGANPLFDESPLDLGRDLVSGAQVQWNRRPFETDLLLVQHNRLRLISVTTQVKQDQLKAKMFEAQVRARQIGGGQAYAAVISPAAAVRFRGQTIDPVEECQAAIDPARNHRFFGKGNLEEWIHGRSLDSLAQYLRL